MEISRFDTQTGLKQRRDDKEPNWRKELPLPARLAMGSAWLTLVGCLALTVIAWNGARRDIEEQARERFDSWVEDIDTAVQARMQAQAQILRGARGLFDASNTVSRQEWHTYANALQLQKTYPGIEGIGFAKQVERNELEKHVREVRAEGFADYSVRPPGERAEYTPILYLEPFNRRNRRAFGFDMFFEPTRREAMEKARDTGEATISGKVTLVQETEQDTQAGFLMYLPVYRHGVPTTALSQRRQALLGYVYSPFRMHDLMAGILGRTLTDVNLMIYDGTTVSDATLMYDSHAEHADRTRHSRFTAQRVIEVQGHPWTLTMTSLSGFESGIPDQRPKMILQSGIFISLLMFIVVWSLATLRRRATALAEDMTEALRESREQFRAVAESANEAIISADAQGNITYFNQAAERVFDYRSEDILGRPVITLIPRHLQAAHLAGMHRFLVTGVPRVIGKSVELSARRRDGSEFPIEISVAYWSTPAGIFFTAMLRDISERVEAGKKIHRLNSELQHQVEQLAEVNQELESFSYSVSHDLRAPLRAINGFARMLDEGYGQRLDSEGQRLLRVIRDNSRKMGQLIDDLLAFARLGKTPVTRAQVDMDHLVEEVIHEICEAGDGRQAYFSVNALPPARGDRALLHQVWMNLIANAVKFTRLREAPRIEAGCRQKGGELLYFVRDNGVGFDMAHASHLFGVFQRLHKAEQFPGTGVGLAIVQRIISKHGGRVWAESKPDSGATFYFSLPQGGEET